jgi:hypothetical protein
MQAEAVSGADRVVAALQKAATATGSDFHYLLGTAMRESSLRPHATSNSSSATGLFQFVDQTWLSLVKEHGAQYGLGKYADAITKQADGHYCVDTDAKDSVLGLRKNPEICALMAGEYAKSTQCSLRASLGRDVCGGELYAAHFLGPHAAVKLIKLANSDPGVSAPAEFPHAAAANKAVFFHTDGSAKSVREVYDWAMQQPGGEGTLRIAQPADAGATTILTQQAVHSRISLAQSAEVQTLLASVMNWQPRHSMLSAVFGASDATSSSAISFGPDLLGLLSGAKDSQS